MNNIGKLDFVIESSKFHFNSFPRPVLFRINLASVKECATFCSQREFCRSAVYNSRTKTCGISYEYTVACASRTQRYKEYKLEEGQGTDLVQIACVDDCRNREEKDTDKKEKKVPVSNIFSRYCYTVLLSYFVFLS